MRIFALNHCQEFSEILIEKGQIAVKLHRSLSGFMTECHTSVASVVDLRMARPDRNNRTQGDFERDVIFDFVEVLAVEIVLIFEKCA